MKWQIMLVTILSAAPVAPAEGQTIVDTFHNLRSTVRQLGSKPKPGPGTGAADAAAPGAPPAQMGEGSRVDAGQDALMVPASVVMDDASDTALERMALVPRRIETFDVRDLRLGMSPREAGRVADRQHFRRRWNSIFFTSGTFDVEAARIANFKLNRPVEKSSKVQLRQVQGFDPSGDELKCEFTLEPSGPKLSKITFYAKLNGMTLQQTIDALIRKYGPTNAGDRSLNVLGWTGGESDYSSSPLLHAVVDGDHLMLTLEQSYDYMQGAQRRLNERAQQIAATRGGGVRF